MAGPKKTPRSQPGRQAGGQRQSNRRQSESSSSHPLAVLPVCLPARKRAVNYARQSKCIHVRLLNVIYNQPPTTQLLPFSDFFFSFAVHTRNHSLAFMPFNAIANANSSRPRPGAHSAGQKLCKNLFARLPGNNNNNNNNANKNNNNASGCLAALTNAIWADLQQFSILMCIIKYLRNIIHSLLLPAELKLIP